MHFLEFKCSTIFQCVLCWEHTHTTHRWSGGWRRVVFLSGSDKDDVFQLSNGALTCSIHTLFQEKKWEGVFTVRHSLKTRPRLLMKNIFYNIPIKDTIRPFNSNAPI